MQLEMLDPDGLIFIIHDFLSGQECQEFILTGEALGFSPAPLTTARGPVMAPERRSNTRAMVDDPALGQRMWERLQPLVPRTLLDFDDVERQAVGLNERFRFFRYDPQQHFARHYDGCYRRDNGETSLFTFMMYLNEGFQGGETRFYSDHGDLRVRVRPRRGMALLFVHNLLHEGARVVQGRKYVLRSDVMYRRPMISAGGVSVHYQTSGV